MSSLRRYLHKIRKIIVYPCTFGISKTYNLYSLLIPVTWQTADSGELTHENQRWPWLSTMPIFNHDRITKLYSSKDKQKVYNFFTFTTALFSWTPLTYLRTGKILNSRYRSHRKDIKYTAHTDWNSRKIKYRCRAYT